MEELGLPATVVITEPFQHTVASYAVRLGASGYHTVVVPHPIWSRNESQLHSLARRAAEVARHQLLGA